MYRLAITVELTETAVMANHAGTLDTLRPLQNATNFTFQSNFGLICEEIGYL
jgi:hypothetical protein